MKQRMTQKINCNQHESYGGTLPGALVSILAFSMPHFNDVFSSTSSPIPWAPSITGTMSNLTPGL